MHVPDGFLRPGVAAATWAVACAAVAAALRAERRGATPMPSGVLGSVAAFLFAVQLVNVPVAGGTSGHMVGAMLAVTLLGPWRGMLAMATVLSVQALLFQDGGITAFGANFIDMGLSGCLVGYAVARMASRWIRGPRGVAAGAILGGFAATLCGAALTAVWLSLSGLYPLSGILPVMLVTHVAIGLLEAALTGAIVVTLLRVRPDLTVGIGGDGGEQSPAALGIGVLGVALLVVLIAAPLASTLPDGLEHTMGSLGLAPLPTRELPWARLARLAPAVAGVVGVLAASVLAWAITRAISVPNDAPHR